VSAGWRLFERLQERVLRIFIHQVSTFNQRDPTPSLNGVERKAGGEGADLLNLDRV
jgi:hypothetical protein